MFIENSTLTDSEVVDQVREQVKCEDAQIISKDGNLWQVLTATPESRGSIRTSYRMTTYTVDVTGPEIAIQAL